MKALGLLVCLVLLGIGMLLLLVSFLSLDFYWGSFLIYLGIALLVYGIVWLVGCSLNGRFDRAVQGFLRGKADDLAYDGGSLRTFGLLIVTMLPFLVYLLLFDFYAVITFAVYGMRLISQTPTLPPSFPAILLSACAAIVMGCSERPGSGSPQPESLRHRAGTPRGAGGEWNSGGQRRPELTQPARRRE